MGAGPVRYGPSGTTGRTTALGTRSPPVSSSSAIGVSGAKRQPASTRTTIGSVQVLHYVEQEKQAPKRVPQPAAPFPRFFWGEND